MNEISALRRRTRELAYSLSALWGHNEKLQSLPGRGSHQNPILLAPWFQIASLQDWEKVVLVLATRSMVSCSSSPNWWRQPGAKELGTVPLPQSLKWFNILNLLTLPHPFLLAETTINVHVCGFPLSFLSPDRFLRLPRDLSLSPACGTTCRLLPGTVTSYVSKSKHLLVHWPHPMWIIEKLHFKQWVICKWDMKGHGERETEESEVSFEQCSRGQWETEAMREGAWTAQSQLQLLWTKDPNERHLKKRTKAV